MKIFKSINKLNKEVNFKANIGFVPTMGALHVGHISLIKKSRSKCKKTVVSIFINPSQFNKIKDFKSYPRNFKKDIEILKKLKVDYLLLPKKNEIYKNKREMKIKLNNNDKILCAKFRKGHFEGVLAVINKFLKKIDAKYIFLGEKDYQQIYLIKKYIGYRFNTKIIPCKTIRLNNSLPYSSRNILIPKEKLETASFISSALKKLHAQIKKNFNNVNKIKLLKKVIELNDVNVEYIEIRNKYNLSNKINKNNFKIFISYYINKVRLIDNF